MLLLLPLLPALTLLLFLLTRDPVELAPLVFLTAAFFVEAELAPLVFLTAAFFVEPEPELALLTAALAAAFFAAVFPLGVVVLTYSITICGLLSRKCLPLTAAAVRRPALIVVRGAVGGHRVLALLIQIDYLRECGLEKGKEKRGKLPASIFFATAVVVFFFAPTFPVAFLTPAPVFALFLTTAFFFSTTASISLSGTVLFLVPSGRVPFAAAATFFGFGFALC